MAMEYLSIPVALATVIVLKHHQKKIKVCYLTVFNITNGLEDKCKYISLNKCIEVQEN